MRIGADQASVAYLRTVNNPNLPSRLSWRTFSTFAECTAARTTKKELPVDCEVIGLQHAALEPPRLAATPLRFPLKTEN